MLFRARSSHNLALLLAVILAWPANVSVLARDFDHSKTVSPTSVVRPIGASIRRADHRPGFDQANWSEMADNTEGFDGRDDLRYCPLAIPHHPLELPSLIPSPLGARLPHPAGWTVPSPRSAPLRC